MLPEERKNHLLTYLHNHGAGRLSALSSLFGVSISTLRRDVAALESRHLVRRTHGGVMSADQVAGHTDGRVVPDGNGADEPRIARAAATLIRDGSTIVIAGGMLAEAMIPALAGKDGITVITNALNVAWRVCQHPAISGIVLGGWLRQPDCALVGHLTAQAMVDLRADMAFYAAVGLDMERGVTSLPCQDLHTDRELIGIARTVCILADRHAVGYIGPTRVLPIDAVSIVVTDCDGSERTVQNLRSKGTLVIEA